MKIFTTRRQLQQHLLTAANKNIGFVPTMGALHAGHLSLIRQAREGNDIVVCSIFVNPTQFNDPKDLENYPRPIAADINKLEGVGCDILFNPAVTEIYAAHEQWHLDIGRLEFLLEGQYRPGHYQGVMQVVYKLLDIVKPQTLYLGQKDYQQFLVVGTMIALKGLPVKMTMCAIEREPDGLAMSSRNIHLNDEERQHSLIISRALYWVKASFNVECIAQIQQAALAMLKNEAGVEPEYFEIADGETLLPAHKGSRKIIALTAARVGKTRLIDNMILK